MADSTSKNVFQQSRRAVHVIRRVNAWSIWRLEKDRPPADATCPAMEVVAPVRSAGWILQEASSFSYSLE